MAAITLVATVYNCFVPRLPGAHALRGILTETVFERSASVDIIRVSAGVTVTKNSFLEFISSSSFTVTEATGPTGDQAENKRAGSG